MSAEPGSVGTEGSGFGGDEGRMYSREQQDGAQCVRRTESDPGERTLGVALRDHR